VVGRREVNFPDYVDGEYHLADPADPAIRTT
jgi:hypothetical protein